MTIVGNDAILAFLTLGSFGLLIYAYGAYPGLLWVLSKMLGVHERGEQGKPTDWPEVSILLSAYNEEQVIGERMENLLKLDYPRDRLEFIVGSDGSTDDTCSIVKRYATQGIRLVAFERRRGKAEVVNDLVRQARANIVVLTDANTFFRSDAVRHLVKALWRHPTACAVVGRLHLSSPGGSGNLDGVYWRYETWIKRLESHFGCVLGANGAIYAFHRERYPGLPQGAIIDDFLIPMLMRLHAGGTVIFVPEATAYETSPAGVRHEFLRRVRIGAGDLQALIWTWRLLLPWQGMVALAYFSHKVLRWFGPWFMLTGFLGNVWLLDYRVFRLVFLIQAAFYTLALVASPVKQLPILGRVAYAAQYAVMLNAALLLGFVRFAFGLQRGFWSPAPRRP